jgi:hypothetical protein
LVFSAEAFFSVNHLKSFTWFSLSRHLLTALLVLSLVPYAVAVRVYVLISYSSSVYCYVPFHYSQCQKQPYGLRWAGHVARMGDKRNAVVILVVKTEALA